MAYFDDDRELLEMRVKKLEAGSAWSEDPPSRSRHFVTNVRILASTATRSRSMSASTFTARG